MCYLDSVHGVEDTIETSDVEIAWSTRDAIRPYIRIDCVVNMTPCRPRKNAELFPACTHGSVVDASEASASGSSGYNKRLGLNSNMHVYPLSVRQVLVSGRPPLLIDATSASAMPSRCHDRLCSFFGEKQYRHPPPHSVFSSAGVGKEWARGLQL